MITRLEIDGFKSLVGLRVDVRPTTVFVGPNGAGKSNIFDALRLVADCVHGGFDTAFTDQPRGHGPDLFHRTAAGIGPHMLITVGLLLDSPYGPLPARVRLQASWQDDELVPGPKSAMWVSALKDRSWMRRLGLSGAWEAAIGQAVDAVPGDQPRHLPLSTTGAHAPLRLWIEDECRSWRPLELDPATMRRPVPGVGAIKDLLRPDGANLAAVLERLSRHGLLAGLNVDLATLISDVREVQPLFDKRRSEYDFDLVFRDGQHAAPPLLSEGTLRVLALLAAAYDRTARGPLAVEELEDGLHPARLAEVLRRLRRDVADYRETPPARDTGLRQLLLTTHSPVLVAAMRDAPDGSLVFVDTATRITRGGGPGHKITVARPVLRTPPPDADLGTYATDYEVRRILETVAGGGG
ncbi:MAG TPA: ATP-binding protein [Yinghuangia sp.]|uniref:AAA family ATPase n=1 Tax=Yinghuangia sp. YIM S10712 TaxID=3436930 RepID=UPI002D171A40|nr:ATP-binding protein [Yinghuangia sp.]